ncbi:hypothetical protein F5Y13DRAFT_205661 [Hypoxylon sp. FL1857]|nr:hypothetical protein F5Y13DRAFT_205661 [Hypoxylon sp. FL1857]
MSIPLANCPAKGTNRRECELPFTKLPDLAEIKSILSQMTSDFDWSLPEDAENPTKHNIYLRNIDKFLHDFESHREGDTLAQFISTTMLPEFAARPEDEILSKVAELAQMRALLINYLLGSRVSPAMHQEIFDKLGPPPGLVNKSANYKSAMWRARQDTAKRLLQAFWGSKESGNPLPSHRHKAMGISAYKNWADLIDKKLTDMRPRLEKKFSLLDWNEWTPQKELKIATDDSGYDSKDDKKIKSRKDNKDTKSTKSTKDTKDIKDTKDTKGASIGKAAGGSGSGNGSTKFTKEVSSDQHTLKRRGVLPASADTESANADGASDEEVEKLISPKLEKVSLEDRPSPKRKGKE